MKTVQWATVFLMIVGMAGCGGSDSDNPDSSTPAAPSSVTATVDATSGLVTLSWTVSAKTGAAAAADSYRIYMASESGVTKSNYVELANNMYHPDNVTLEFPHDDSINDGLPRYFVVTAVNADGESIESCEVEATPPATPTGTEEVTTCGQ
jgi:fibronectin type 3 domain-containing protein